MNHAEAQASILLYGSIRKAAANIGISKSSLHNFATGRSKTLSEKSTARASTAMRSLPAKDKSAIRGGSRLLRNLTEGQLNKVMKNREHLRGDKFRKAVKEYVESAKKGKAKFPEELIESLREGETPDI